MALRSHRAVCGDVVSEPSAWALERARKAIARWDCQIGVLNGCATCRSVVEDVALALDAAVAERDALRAQLIAAERERDVLRMTAVKLGLKVLDANVVMRAIDGEVKAGRLQTRTNITDAREGYSDPFTYPDVPALTPTRGATP